MRQFGNIEDEELLGGPAELPPPEPVEEKPRFSDLQKADAAATYLNQINREPTDIAFYGFTGERLPPPQAMKPVELASDARRQVIADAIAARKAYTQDEQVDIDRKLDERRMALQEYLAKQRGETTQDFQILGSTPNQANPDLVDSVTVYDRKSGQVKELAVPPGTRMGGLKAPMDGVLDTLRAQALQQNIESRSLQDQIDKRNLEMKEKEFEREFSKPKMSEAEKKVDEKFAQELLDWDSVDSVQFETNFKKLKETRDKIAKAAKTSTIPPSGRIVGVLPDIVKPEQNIDFRENVHSQAVMALRPVLGAQFTEKEGERIMNFSYNERLSPEANLERIDRTLEDLQKRAKIKQSKADYFRKNGSLKGWSPPVSTKFNLDLEAGKTAVELPIGTIRPDKNGKNRIKTERGWELMK